MEFVFPLCVFGPLSIEPRFASIVPVLSESGTCRSGGRGTRLLFTSLPTTTSPFDFTPLGVSARPAFMFSMRLGGRGTSRVVRTVSEAGVTELWTSGLRSGMPTPGCSPRAGSIPVIEVLP